MQKTMAEHGVTMYALSKDTPAISKKFIASGLSNVALLSDPKLEVIEQFGLLHSTGFEFFSTQIAGLPIGVPRGTRRMAIPTTLLVDEQGVVQWIDQADDYRLRGDEDRIAAALAKVFGGQVAETTAAT